MTTLFDHLQDMVLQSARFPEAVKVLRIDSVDGAFYTLHAVGTQTGNGVATLPDLDHEGHSGWRIDQIDAIVLSVLGQIAGPDVILLLIGTNDYGQGYDTAHAAERRQTTRDRI